MDPREIVTVPCRLVKELQASWILAGERLTHVSHVPTRRTKGSVRNLGVRAAYGKDGQRIGFTNCRTLETAVPIRVSKAKVVGVGQGKATMPRWLAVQAGLL